MQEYVVGFMFDTPGAVVVLIRKNRPEWQAGKLNGVGGKIEPGELAYDAMVREFKEETGLYHTEWQNYAVLESPRSKVWVYRTFVQTNTLTSVRTMEDEPIELHNTHRFNYAWEGVPNLSWLVPAAKMNRGEYLEVRYP